MSDQRPPGLPEAFLEITIDPPLQFKGGEFSVLKLREPTAAEVRKAEGFMRTNPSMETMRMRDMSLVTSVSGWPQGAVEMMPISKLNEAMQYIDSFISYGRATG